VPSRATGRAPLVGYHHLSAGCSAAWLARLLWEQEAAGSNPASPTRSPDVIRTGQRPDRKFNGRIEISRLRPNGRCESAAPRLGYLAVARQWNWRIGRYLIYAGERCTGGFWAIHGKPRIRQMSDLSGA
jgi:hypothetical protein